CCCTRHRESVPPAAEGRSSRGRNALRPPSSHPRLPAPDPRRWYPPIADRPIGHIARRPGTLHPAPIFVHLHEKPVPLGFGDDLRAATTDGFDRLGRNPEGRHEYRPRPHLCGCTTGGEARNKRHAVRTPRIEKAPGART